MKITLNTQELSAMVKEHMDAHFNMGLEDNDVVIVSFYEEDSEIFAEIDTNPAPKAAATKEVTQDTVTTAKPERRRRRTREEMQADAQATAAKPEDSIQKLDEALASAEIPFDVAPAVVHADAGMDRAALEEIVPSGVDDVPVVQEETPAPVVVETPVAKETTGPRTSLFPKKEVTEKTPAPAEEKAPVKWTPTVHTSLPVPKKEVPAEEPKVEETAAQPAVAPQKSLFAGLNRPKNV